MRKQQHYIEILLVAFFITALLLLQLSSFRLTPLFVLAAAFSYLVVNTSVDLSRKRFKKQYLLQYTFNSLLALSIGLLII